MKAAKKRTPKVVGVRKRPPPKKTLAKDFVVYTIAEKTKKEKVFDIIYDECRIGCRFADNYYGIPFIELKDLEEKEDGIYVIRFRCEPKYTHPAYFGKMSEEVGKKFKTEIRFVHEQKREWGIPYEECVWVLQIGEKYTDIPIWRKIFMAETKIPELAPEDNPHPRKCTHVRWDEFLQAHYSRTLLSVAQELGYSEQNLDILGGDFENAAEKKRIYKKHKRLFDDFLADERNKRLMDGRKVYEYFKDLIASWVGEDLLVKALNEYGFNASVANADRDRIIKTNYVGVTGNADIKIEYEGNTRYLELMDALSPVEKFGRFDMRQSKAKNQFTQKNLFLLHGLSDGKYVLIDFMRDNIEVTYNYPNERYGNKPCSVVRMQENGIKMHEMSLFWESLKDIMLNTKPEPADHYLKLVDYKSSEVEMLTAKPSQEEQEPEDSDSSEGEDDIAIPVGEEQTLEEEKQEETVIEQEPQPISEEHPIAGAEEQTAEDTSEPEESTENIVVEETQDGNAVEYTAEQWAALTEWI